MSESNTTVAVLVRHYSDAWVATAGQGKAARKCSCTSAPQFAVKRAAAKFFGCHEERVSVSGDGSYWTAIRLPSSAEQAAERTRQIKDAVVVEAVVKPFGHYATVLVGDKSMVGLPIGTPTTKVIYRKGPRSACERAAKLTRKFISIESIEPCTEEQFIRAFGSGRM